MRTILILLLIVVVAVLAAAKFNHASRQVAFMGDSLTQGWSFPTANFGIHGQTTEQMLARFPQQIPGHGFRETVILGGTNDTLLGISPEVTTDNLGRMVDEARQAGIEPVLAEIPPIYTGGGKFLPAVATLDEKIRTLAETKQVKLIDYYDTLLNQQDCYSDGTHLKRRGYLRMELALTKTINPF